MQQYHCWFEDEGENKGDTVPAHTAQEAAEKHEQMWHEDNLFDACIYVRDSTQRVTKWRVIQSVTYTATEQT